MPSIWKKNFKTGLIRAAKAAANMGNNAANMNTWIITGGLNVGAMKLVGDSIAEEIRTENVTVLGINSWGKVLQRHLLEVKFFYLLLILTKVIICSDQKIFQENIT